MNKDSRGVAMPGASDKALARYETAIQQFQSYVGDPVATLDEAIAESPDFVSGHLMKALVLYTLAERRYSTMAKDALEAAKPHLSSATERERGLAQAAQQLVDGRWDDACATLDRVLASEPRDAVAIQAAHLMDFYRGDALNLRNRITRVLPHWDASAPGYSYILGMHAFGLEEMNQYPEAEAAALRALEIERKDGWAVHAAVHVMEMQGRIDEGINFLRTRESDWAPDNAFAFHNFWHLALYYMDGARYDDALALFDRHVHPEPAPFLLSLVDATALLWRLRLEGVDVGDRAKQVADEWASHMRTEAGFYAFNDAHAAMAFAMTGRDADMKDLSARMEEAARGKGPGARITAEVGIPVAQGLASFGRGDYRGAIANLEPVRDIAHRFGGSHAQRDLLSLTLIEAAVRAGDKPRAKHYAAERLVHKPASAWGKRLWARSGMASA